MCHYIQVSKIFLLNKIRSRISIDIVLSHSLEKSRTKKISLLSFRNLPGSKKFIAKRWEYQVSSSKNFRLSLPKKFVKEPYTVSLNLGIEMFMDKW